MKKTLLAAALAVGFAGAAHAQTSVTLYGVLDEGFGYAQSKTNLLGGGSVKTSRTGLFGSHQNGSRFGLRGSEDLGGGLKAIFTLEGGINQNEGISAQNGRLFGRQAFFGLESDSWGRLTAGRQYGLGVDLATVISPHGDIYGLNSVHFSMASATGAVRVDNLVKYETPDFSGFKLSLGYSFQYGGPQPVDVKGGRDVDQTYAAVGLRYTNGPLILGINYDQLNKRDSLDGIAPNVGEKDIKSWVFAGSYNFDVASLHLGFGQDRDGVLVQKTGTVLGLADNINYMPNFKANNYSLGFGIPVDSGRVMVNWQSSRLGGGVIKNTNRVLGGKNSQNIYTLAYRYDLSRRTNVYATVGFANGFSFNDTKRSEVVVGLRHGF